MTTCWNNLWCNSILSCNSDKYHKQLDLWKKEIESLLPQKGKSAAIDKRILELDTKLEKSIDGHAAIPDKVKNDLRSNKLDELIEKIDLLLKEE